jgi:hypothetical protein
VATTDLVDVLVPMQEHKKHEKQVIQRSSRGAR